MASTVLVTGGTGRLGTLVVARLLAEGRDVRALARHAGNVPHDAEFCRADLRARDGLDEAVRAVGTIIHCATSTKGDADATRNLVAAASRAGKPHFVYVSIVGIEHIATWGYPKEKLAAERIVETGGLPWTILRVTQFYDYILDNARRLSKFPIAPVPAGFAVKPVDPFDVAERLVELALGGPAGRATELAGPQQSDWVDLLRSYLAATHQRRWVVPMVIPGTRSVRRGGLLPAPQHAVGSRTWDEFLAAKLHSTIATP